MLDRTINDFGIRLGSLLTVSIAPLLLITAGEANRYDASLLSIVLTFLSSFFFFIAGFFSRQIWKSIKKQESRKEE
ncbi:hypothetical protein DTL42_13435 [Bremerella cremea]|uniref:Uncharacterized protein n=1 Tax=Bremerella cremea TaxID=1031537 RepID=A0A368KQK6_9BACT|nr:hypothetical protein DTL42_13435 [Bremerella cremea]